MRLIMKNNELFKRKKNEVIVDTEQLNFET